MGHIRPEDYNTAIEVQCAVNLQAVIKSFSDILTRIQADAREAMLGTDWVKHHPISRLFAEQIAYLAANCAISTDWMGFNAAYQECLKHSTDACKVERPRHLDPKWRELQKEVEEWKKNPAPTQIISKPMEMKEIVHGLSSGRAFCGLPGIPKDWPQGHRWVSPRSGGGRMTCPKCIEVLRNVTKGK